MPGTNADVAQRAYEAFGRGDVDAVLGNFAEDVEFHVAEGLPWGGLHQGRQEVAEKVFGRLAEEFDAFTVTPKRYIESGDTVVVLGRYSWAGDENEAPVDAAFVHVWTLAHGKLKELHQLTDTVRMTAAMSSHRTAPEGVGA